MTEGVDTNPKHNQLARKGTALGSRLGLELVVVFGFWFDATFRRSVFSFIFLSISFLFCYFLLLLLLSVPSFCFFIRYYYFTLCGYLIKYLFQKTVPQNLLRNSTFFNFRFFPFSFLSFFFEKKMMVFHKTATSQYSETNCVT
eukprot:TRINITY_DN5556_c0_g1_i1.p1 TRINITY_DN5556_c0_g1~~TRINITY_DN5556_c0_g1_i1.p1  ORF type:complete len:143 (+),score=10.04 TRINITY_DN5556_c0_g1_i1:292-720(+)